MHGFKYHKIIIVIFKLDLLLQSNAMLTDDSFTQWKHQNCTDDITTRKQLEPNKHQAPDAACTNQISLHLFFLSKGQELYLMTVRKVTKLLSSTPSHFPCPAFCVSTWQNGWKAIKPQTRKYTRKQCLSIPGLHSSERMRWSCFATALYLD